MTPDAAEYTIMLLNTDSQIVIVQHNSNNNSNNNNIQSCMSSHLELLLLLTFHFWISSHNTSVLKKKGNPDRKTFAMWKIARIGRGKHQKRGNKKSGKSRTPIRYDVWYIITVDSQLSIARSIHLPASMSPSYMDELCIRVRKNHTKLPTFRHYTCLHKIHSQWTLLSPEHYPIPPMWQDWPWKTK